MDFAKGNPFTFGEGGVVNVSFNIEEVIRRLFLRTYNLHFFTNHEFQWCLFDVGDMLPSSDTLLA